MKREDLKEPPPAPPPTLLAYTIKRHEYLFEGASLDDAFLLANRWLKAQGITYYQLLKKHTT